MYWHRSNGTIVFLCILVVLCHLTLFLFQVRPFCQEEANVRVIYWHLLTKYPFTIMYGLTIRLTLRDGPLENLWGGGRAKYKKNIRARENEMKKNSCTPINPKKYSCYGLKKFIQGIWWRKKIPAARKFRSPPPTPHNFSNGQSLTIQWRYALTALI